MNSHTVDWTNLKINVLTELEMKFQDREHQMFLSTTPMVGKSSRRPTHSSRKSSAPIYQAKQSRASCAKLLTASPCRKQLRECQEKKSFSLLKKPAIKRLFGTKSKRSSKKDKVGIQKSSGEIRYGN